MISSVNKNRKIGAIALNSMYLILILILFAMQSIYTLIAGTVLCVLYVTVSPHQTILTRNMLTIMACASLLFFPAFFKPYHGFSPIFYMFATLVNLASADKLARNSAHVLMRSFQATYWFSVFLIAIVLYRYWGDPEPFGRVIEGSSTNGIPAYLIVLQVGLSLTSYLATNRLPIIPALCTGVVAFYGAGRGSLVVAALLISGTFVLNLIPNDDKLKYKFAYYGLFLVATAVLILYGGVLFDYISRYTKLSVGLVDENRIIIFRQYLEKIDTTSAILGADYSGTIIEYSYRGNPHISYIRTHSFFGIFVTIAAILSPTVVLFSKRRIHVTFVFFFLIGAVALRAYSEPILFPTLLDVLYFSYFFIFFRYAATRT
jgi:hypothetical protein